MTTTAILKTILLETVACLYILLFTYAAVSKLIDFENFQIQIAQSILLTAFAGPVSYLVILLETVIAVLIAIPATRRVALYAAFALMMLFSVYIFIILHYAHHITCSCGGVLEKMTWNQHLVFNLIFAALAFVAIVIQENRTNTAQTFARLLVVAALSISFMTALFWVSSNTSRQRNSFTRTFVPFGINEVARIDLKFNSYYFAGSGNDHIYLANLMAPSKITSFTSALQKKTVDQIKLSDTTSPFHSIRIKVTPPDFFVFDGTVPSIHSGNTKEWKASLIMRDLQHFDLAEPVSPNTIIFRAPTVKFGNRIGAFHLDQKEKVQFNPNLLQKQIDGTFDTDGLLLYNQQNKKFIYLYYYRNQYTVANQNLQIMHRGNTIDTTARARIKVATLHKGKQTTMAAPAVFVNRLAATNGNLLFVNSMLPGKVEPLEIWDSASIVDVYDFIKKEYRISFYVYANGNTKMNSFLVMGTHLFALFENELIAYTLSPKLQKILNH